MNVWIVGMLFCLCSFGGSESLADAASFVTILSPAAETPFVTNEYIRVCAEAVGAAGISKTSLYVDGQWAGSDSSAPYEYELSGLSSGTHAIKVSARDGNGVWVNDIISINVVSYTGMFVRVDYPAENTTLFSGESFTVQSVAFAEAGVHHASLRIDGVWKASDFVAPYEFDVAGLTAGTHTLQVSVQDDVGAWKYESVSVNVVEPPVVWSAFVTSNSFSDLYDWSFAGYKHGLQEIPEEAGGFSVTNWGAFPDDGQDDTDAIQSAINDVGSAGGGVLYFEPGEYLICSTNNWDPLRIQYDHVILRGAGALTAGTVFHVCMTNLTGPDGYGECAIIAGIGFSGVTSQLVLQDVAQGETWIPMASTSGFSTGQVVRIRMFNPFDENGVRTDLLSRELIAPMVPETTWENFNSYDPFVFFAEVASVESGGIQLVEPLPRTLKTNYNAKVQGLAGMVSGVGVEHIMFTSNYGGGYVHHGSWEDDYGWCGIEFKGVRDGWIRNVNFMAYSRQIVLTDSYNVSVLDTVSSVAGHHGVDLSGSYSCLVNHAVFFSPVTHAVSINGGSIGNVVRSLYNFSGELSGIDFHGGGFSSQNLCENMYDLTFFSGGAIENMPHAGQGNVIWNIDCGPKKTVDDFFSWGLFTYSLYGGTYTPADLYRLFPKLVVVGAFDSDGSITVAGQAGTQSSAWLHVEQINNGPVYPASVYQEQVRLKINKN